MMIIKITRMETSKFKGTVDSILIVKDLKKKSAFQQKKATRRILFSMPLDMSL